MKKKRKVPFFVNPYQPIVLGEDEIIVFQEDCYRQPVFYFLVVIAYLALLTISLIPYLVTPFQSLYTPITGLIMLLYNIAASEIPPFKVLITNQRLIIFRLNITGMNVEIAFSNIIQMSRKQIPFLRLKLLLFKFSNRGHTGIIWFTALNKTEVISDTILNAMAGSLPEHPSLLKEEFKNREATYKTSWLLFSFFFILAVLFGLSLYNPDLLCSILPINRLFPL